MPTLPTRRTQRMEKDFGRSLRQALEEAIEKGK
jgi:hypothetical protein